MPIYAYLCTDCGFRKDVLQKVTDAALTTCPQCGKAAFQKQLSAPSFQLKGTGWYATDFKNSGKPAASSSSAAQSDGAGNAAASGGASKASTDTASAAA
ncbi:FmdB family transcriptional regulator [Lampropedia cohaerens]|uniref:FmdB family transcriptional regulator n=1 Tax=Lampropedia cohaerens TaxID=1610491 RepID=A0A0U1Q3E1_9BURK|nr:FmdB family zinc ribbon protein [Lampropedia cohaerens]KKW69272.1 FmdB family transcriptional regulator [Lampropedia cohaerens]